MHVNYSIAEQLVSVIPTPAFAVDMEMKITYINELAIEILGRRQDDIIGSRCHDVFTSNLCQKGCPLKKCIKQKKIVKGMEVAIDFSNGKSIDALVNALPLFSDDDEVVGGIEIVRDITAERKLQEKVKEDEDRIDEYHNATMELAMGMSEFFQVLSEVRDGNLDVRVSEQTLASEDEVIANLAQSLNDTIIQIDDNVNIIHKQRFAIEELSTPVLQVWDNVLALPIIGIVDSQRIVDIMERLLTEITAKQSRFVILDITGVELVDTKTADHFIKVIKAAQLLGARCILTGIRSAMAQTLVELDIDLSTVTTLGNLQEGLKECLRQMNDHREVDLLRPASGAWDD